MDIEKQIIIGITEYERKKLKIMMSDNRKIKGGSIKKRRKGNRFYYTEYINGKERGITKDKERIQLLYRKKYLASTIKKNKLIIKNLDLLLEKIEKIAIDNDSLLFGVYSHDDFQWMQEDYDTNPLYPERLIYKTSLGTMVRSKSELNIANTLERLGIPYRYEQKIYINGATYYPDFVILLPNGKLLIWEHNGLMDDDMYADRAYMKIREYEKSGYRQHKNLIITYEDDIRTPQQIENIIKRFYVF